MTALLSVFFPSQPLPRQPLQQGGRAVAKSFNIKHLQHTLPEGG